MSGFSKRDVIPGMAHFRGSGPVGKTCADCAEFRARVGTKEPDGTCDAFYRSARKIGAALNPSNAACLKYLPSPAQAPKPAPAPPRPALPQKICAMPNCQRPVDAWAQFCGYHWFGLPESQQQRVTAARKLAPPVLAAAISSAVGWLQTEGGRP